MKQLRSITKSLLCVALIAALLLSNSWVQRAKAEGEQTQATQETQETTQDTQEATQESQDPTLSTQETTQESQDPTEETQKPEKRKVIKVTNALNGAELYSGDDLQEAFDHCIRGSIVSFDKFYTLTSDAVLDVEIMLTNINRVDMGSHKILLTGNGAFFVDERMRMKNYGAKYAKEYGSTAAMSEESGGYVYYLESKAPVFNYVDPKTNKQLPTTVERTGSLLAGQVDETNKTLTLDAAVNGISVNSFKDMIQIPVQYSADQYIEKAFQGASSGRIANGTVLTVSAGNADYPGTVTKQYSIILVGDVNGNGLVDAADASLITAHVSGTGPLSGNALQAADANRDGKVTAADADLLCRKYIRRDSYTSPLN